MLRSSVILILGLLGHFSTPIDIDDNIYLFLENGQAFSITAYCTYIDLVLIMAPFCWRFQSSLATNVRRLAALAATLLTLNVIRVSLAMHFQQLNAPWQLVHTVPHLMIHFSAITIIVLLALRQDRMVQVESGLT